MLDDSDADLENGETSESVVSFVESLPEKVRANAEDICDYKIISRIARGSFGDIFRATRKDKQTTVVLKKLPIQIFNHQSEKVAKEGRREVEAFTKIPVHRNIILFHGVVTDREVVYLSLEFCSRDLHKIQTNRGRFPESMAVSLIHQLLTGLVHIHSNGIIHRDIKPENLLLKGGLLKIADFGSIARDDQTNFSPQVVTLWYRPPEILLGSLKYSTPVDIWSAACVLLELLSGKVFFRGESQISQINQIVDCLGTPRDWPELEDLPVMQCMKLNERDCVFQETTSSFASESLQKILEKMLAYDPGQRATAESSLKDISSSQFRIRNALEIERWLEDRPMVERNRKIVRLNLTNDDS